MGPQGLSSDALRISLMKPILKKEDITNSNNYRPIALLPTSFRTWNIEPAMTNRQTSFYENYNIFHDRRKGFRTNRSIVVAVYKYFQKILDINNMKYAIDLLLLDMSKAYDRVNYNILLNKLYKVTYVSNRKQLFEVICTNTKVREINIKIRLNLYQRILTLQMTHLCINWHNRLIPTIR